MEKSVARAGYEFVVLPCGGGVGPDTENHDFLDFRAAPAFKRSFLTEKRCARAQCLKHVTCRGGISLCSNSPCGLLPLPLLGDHFAEVEPNV